MIQDHLEFFKIIGSTAAIVGGVLYWVLKNKLKEDFCSKTECDKRHNRLSEDIKEIKEIIVRIESRFFDWINKMH